MKEFEVPPLESQNRKGPTTVRMFAPNELPIEIGSLEKEAFSYVGNWYTMKGNDGYSMVYRIATKEGLKDAEGDPTTLILYFAVPIKSPGKETMPQEVANKQYESLAKAMKTFTLQAHQKYHTNIMTKGMETPPWMMKELEELLGGK
jgi:hypothetical protein